MSKYTVWSNLLKDNEIDEITDDSYFPNIFCIGKTEDDINAYAVIESVPHKLPDLSNKYRKFLKESSSDESVKNRHHNEPADIKSAAVNNCDFDKNDDYDMFSNNVNRSRSMLHRFNQANNTADSRVASKNKILSNSRL